MKISKETGFKLENSYTNLPDLFYSKISVNRVESPAILLFNSALAKSLGLNESVLQGEYGASIFAGNEIPKGGIPIAQAYAGHQFGNFTMLGDGRALLLGEHMTPSGERVDVQLKGSGRTPYSRGGDGRAALGPMLREYIISEAMHGLGIPTTRSLAVVTTGEQVIREDFLTGAILTRVASSHIRVGTFQFAARWGTIEDLKALADYTIERHYPNIESDERYLGLLRRVVERQADLIAKWQLVGFIHGVMNTDNMTISGEAIDYGPCAFMDIYNPSTVFSSIDRQGRYAYRNQPLIGGWNLARFAETLLPLIDDDQDKALSKAQEVITGYSDLFDKKWLKGLRAKLGLFNEETEDETLADELLDLMATYKADYTNTFLALTFNHKKDANLFQTEEFKKWEERWEARKGRQPQSENEVHERMKRANPALIPRNHRVEEALEAAVEEENYEIMTELLNALLHPYAHTSEQEKYAELPEPSFVSYKTYCGT